MSDDWAETGLSNKTTNPQTKTAEIRIDLKGFIWKIPGKEIYQRFSGGLLPADLTPHGRRAVARR